MINQNAQIQNWVFLTALTILLPSTSSHGHDEKLHAEMSQQAAFSSENLDLFARDQFVNDDTWVISAFTYNSKSLDVIDWIKQGSIDEDHHGLQTFWSGAGTGTRHHFYTPVPRPARALTDPPVRAPLESMPLTSFKWASDHPEHSESWQKVREYEFSALTSSSKTTRDSSWGHMFYSLGHVIHLNQDLSQPSHTRDDHHGNKKDKNYIEDFGLNVYYENARKSGDWMTSFPSSQLSWSDWQGAGFNKLEDFWDRKFYNGQVQALIDNESHLQLGLAEWSNGNFLSEDALYSELSNSGPPPERHWFPYPSLRTGTDFQTVFRFPASGAKPTYLRSGKVINRVHINKIKEGAIIRPHAALDYFKVKNPDVYPFGITIDSTNVLQAYLSILIPKGIEYSAGIIDYFFRGRLGIKVSLDNLTITNTSGKDLKGGTFRLFCDNTSGVRTELTGSAFVISWSDSSPPLADGATIKAKFTIQSSSTITNYVLVYKGTIGTSDGITPLDSVDATIAIASKTFRASSAWWKMEEASGDRIDSVQSIRLSPNQNVSLDAGQVGGGVLFTPPPGTLSTSSGKLGYGTGDGISIAGSFRLDDPWLVTVGAGVSLQLVNTALQQVGSLSWDFEAPLYDRGTIVASVVVGSSSVSASVPLLPGNTWHFYHLYYNAVSHKVGFQLDNGRAIESAGTLILPLAAIGIVNVSDVKWWPDPDCFAYFDELCVTFNMLTPDEANYVNGRTWPITFP